MIRVPPDTNSKTQQASSTFQSAPPPVPTSTQALDDMKEFSHSALVNLFENREEKARSVGVRLDLPTHDQQEGGRLVMNQVVSFATTKSCVVRTD